MDRRIDETALARLAAEKLSPAQFPRSRAYDPVWMLENAMGPNPVWLAEALSEVLELTPGMRVLDLGCGRAISSIFLAQEFGVQVWAADLWIAPSENWPRIQAAGLEERVFPVRAEAHELPFAAGFFDAVVSLDAYHYFGTDDLYLGEHLTPLVGRGGQLGIVVPGLIGEFDEAPPEHLAGHWRDEPEFWSFHSPAWWRHHWQRSGLVEVTVADTVPDGWVHWLQHDESALELGFVAERFAEFVPAWNASMRIDAGRNLGFTRMVARTTPS